MTVEAPSVTAHVPSIPTTDILSAISILNCSRIGYVTAFYVKAVKFNCFYDRLFSKL